MPEILTPHIEEAMLRFSENEKNNTSLNEAENLIPKTEIKIQNVSDHKKTKPQSSLNFGLSKQKEYD